MGTDIGGLVTKLKTHYTSILEQKDAQGDAYYTDLNDWMAQEFPKDAAQTSVDKRRDLLVSMRDLYNKRCTIKGVQRPARDEHLPAYITSGCGTMQLYLWQLGYDAATHLRGATNAYNVFKCMEKDLRDGGMTSKYPIEICPFMLNLTPGEGVEAFSLTTSIGSSVVTSAYITILYILQSGIFAGHVDQSHPEQELATTVISIMEITGIYEPVNDLRHAVFKSNKGKIEAGQRPRPTILQYTDSYKRVVDDIMSQKKNRQSKKELVLKQIAEHNKAEKVRGSKIKTDEIGALSNTLEQSEWFQRKMKVIYQFQSPQYTSVPTVLLANKYLNASWESGVKKEENALWYGIFEFGTWKADAWLARTDGKFNFRVEESIAKGKKPNLLNQAGEYRDKDPEMAWKMSCLKVWAWPEAVKNNSRARLQELESAWRRGALDDTLWPACMAMKKNFVASDIPWVGAPSQGVGELSEVDPLGAAQIALSTAQRESLESQFREWSQRLGIEASKHKLWLTEVQAYDSKEETDAQRFRNDRSKIRETAVADLTDTYYSSQGFSDRARAATFLANKLVKIADLPPARSPDKLLRIVWADMAQHGLNHSRKDFLAACIELIKETLEQNPDTSTAIIGMPNTPKYGKGLKADASRDDNIKEAQDNVKKTLQGYSGLVSSELHTIIDPETMYSDNRPAHLDFLQLVSELKDADGALRSVFRKGFSWRRGAIPELIKILHRSHFENWSNKLSAASRGNLGEDKERKSWSSGRQLYKSILKYMFHGMGLTPGARVVVQHVTAWDNELMMACVEWNASRQNDVPTLTYVGTGWAEHQSIICKNMQDRTIDELGHQIEEGKYIIPGYDAKAESRRPTSTRPELDDNQFKICRPRYSSKELAITETELQRVTRIFGVEASLKKALETTVADFNKANNPSGVPWKEKRPNPDETVTAAESTSRGVFLQPVSSTTAEDLVKDGAFVFEHTATPKANLNFKMYVPEDGSKVYLKSDDDGVMYFSLGRFVGSFLQGQPAKSAMQGGSQWIEWKYDNLDERVVACKKESSMVGPDVAPVFTAEPVPLKEFFEHLEKNGKNRFKMVSHKFELDDIGRVAGVTPEETTVLPLPTSAPKKAKKMSLENIAGYIDIDVVKKSKMLKIHHNLVYSRFTGKQKM